MNDRPRRSITGGKRGFGIIMSASAAPPGASRRHRPDYWLLVLSAALLSVGLVVVYSISPGLAASSGANGSYFVTKQLLAVVLGIIALVSAAYIPTRRWFSAAQALLIVAAIGSVVVMLTPLDEVYRAHRWIRLGGLSFQVAEIIKLAVLVWAARFLTKQRQNGRLTSFKDTLKPLLIVLVIVGFVMVKFQSDLGSAGVILIIILAMAFIAEVPLKKVGLILGITALLAIVAVGTSGYRQDRLLTFLHPNQDCQSVGYQSCQALIAVGSGGLIGQGLGHGVQAYGYLPEAANDSIFAIMAEKFGFIGMTLIIGIYVLLFGRLKQIIRRTADQFDRLLVVGVLAWVSTQMIINVGAMIGLLPLKGITLPFVSYGGTSLVFLTAALGIVVQISRYTNYSSVEASQSDEKQNINDSLGRRRIGRSYSSSVVSRPRT